MKTFTIFWIVLNFTIFIFTIIFGNQVLRFQAVLNILIAVFNLIMVSNLLNLKSYYKQKENL